MRVHMCVCVCACVCRRGKVAREWVIQTTTTKEKLFETCHSDVYSSSSREKSGSSSHHQKKETTPSLHGSSKKEKRTAASRIPAWSPTAVLTRRYRA